MRAETAFCLLLAGCGAVHTLTRPEGDGGWSPARRQAELGKRAVTAGVALDGGSAVREVPTLPLDLPAALALAAGHNRRIAEAEQLVAQARARVAVARGGLLPETIGSGRYSWYSAPQTNSVDLGPSSPLHPSVITREAEFGVLNGTVTLPLDLSGELRHTLRAAQAGYRGEGARRWATTLGEQAAVVAAYFELLQAERLREVTEQTIALDRTQRANAETRFRNGRLTKNELLVVEVSLRDAEQRLVGRDLAIARARWTLNEVIGLDVDAPTEVADVRGDPVLPPLEEALRTAYAQNPVVVSLLEEQQRLEETARALVSSRLPRVAGGGAIDYTSQTILRPQDVGSGFVGFRWDLGTDGRREAEIAGTHTDIDRNRLVLEGQLREIESAVRLAHAATAERLAAEAAATAAVGQAEENLRIRQQQFDAGRATSEDVLEAEALLASQRATLASARYQAHTRRAELQQLMGLPLDGPVPETR
jgi:outer membrane protein TolC